MLHGDAADSVVLGGVVEGDGHFVGDVRLECHFCRRW